LGKPVYASLGMATIERVHSALGSPKNIKYLFCVSKYPAEYSDYSNQPAVYNAPSLSGTRLYGISDHTLGIETSLVAIGRGAKFVEKHFTLNKALEGSDHKCSITPDELYDLTKYAKLMDKVIRR